MRLTMHQAAVKLDVDADDPVPTVRDVTRLLARAGYRMLAWGESTSPSGCGRHIVLHLRPRPSSPFEVVALQLLLGGDREREALQMFRARRFADAPPWMRNCWNVLYLPHPQRERRRNVHDIQDGNRSVVVAAQADAMQSERK